MNRDNLKNNLNEQENLSADEQKISNLLGGLEKVSAPNDFDFRLKARISAQKENIYQPSIWRTLRYALPLTATVIIAAFVMIQGGLFSPTSDQTGNDFASVNTDQQQIAEKQILPMNDQVVQIANSNSGEANTEINQPDSFIAKPKPEDVKEKSPKKQNDPPLNLTKEDNFNGNKLIASRPSNVNIQPERMSGNTATVNKDFIQNVSVTAKEILNDIGVETESTGNKLRVKSVKANSPAERSGVKKGDIIEAIDEQKLEQGNLPSNFKGGKTVTVTRDNKVLEIELKPN